MGIGSHLFTNPFVSSLCLLPSSLTDLRLYLDGHRRKRCRMVVHTFAEDLSDLSGATHDATVTMRSGVFAGVLDELCPTGNSSILIEVTPSDILFESDDPENISILLRTSDAARRIRRGRRNAQPSEAALKLRRLRETVAALSPSGDAADVDPFSVESCNVRQEAGSHWGGGETESSSDDGMLVGGDADSGLDCSSDDGDDASSDEDEEDPPVLVESRRPVSMTLSAASLRACKKGSRLSSDVYLTIEQNMLLVSRMSPSLPHA